MTLRDDSALLLQNKKYLMYNTEYIYYLKGRPRSGELRPIEQTIKDPQDETKYAKYKVITTHHLL